MDYKNIDFVSLKKSIYKHHKKIIKSVYKKHSTSLALAKVNALSIVGGALLAGSVVVNNVNSTLLNKVLAFDLNNSNKKNSSNDFDKIKQDLANFKNLNNMLLENPDNLTLEQELFAESTLSNIFSSNYKVTLNGNRMLRVWGYFGQEQHLYRWQGDSIDKHDEYLQHGLAPATGAFGYFDNASQEKWYIAAPIHMLPNWNTNWSILKSWYKFRKVFVYNPKNKKSVIAVIGDVGPAEWTGKHFGGSPELMHYLEMKDGRAKTKAIVLFVDGSDNKLELGPISQTGKIYNNLTTSTK